MINKPFVSIIILNYNGIKYLKNCIKSLNNIEYSKYEIILVDNASTDGSIEWVINNYPNICIIRNTKNLGASKGYNIGINKAKGKYVTIINSDMMVDKNWLLPLVNLLEKNKNIAAADSKYLDYYDNTKFDRASAGGRVIDYFGNVLAYGSNREDKGDYDKPRKVFAAMAIFRKKIFNEIGLFDEDFFICYEDIDLSWRINLFGYQIYYVPKSIIYHVSRASTTKDGKLKPYFYMLEKRNRIISVIKNTSALFLCLIIPVIILEYIGLFFYWVFKKEKIYAYSVISAIFHVILSFKKTWIKHIYTNKLKKVTQKEIMKNMTKYEGYIKSLNIQLRNVN